MKNQFKGTPGPWESSKTRSMVLHKEGLICDVTHGSWGDEYIDLELIGSSLDRKCIGVPKIIEYGNVPKEVATANANLIAAAPELLEALKLLAGWSAHLPKAADEDLAFARTIINKALGHEQ